jgi:hypothetical protein
MKITNIESLSANGILRLANGDSIEMTEVFGLDYKKRLLLTDDLKLEFSDGTELLLPYGRNYRNTATNDVIVVEDESSEKLLFCGGLIAYVVSNGRICTTIETAYNDVPFPMENRKDFGEFEVFFVGSKLVLLWDYGVAILDSEFNLLDKREKWADDILDSTSATRLTFKSSFNHEIFEITLD